MRLIKMSLVAAIAVASLSTACFGKVMDPWEPWVEKTQPYFIGSTVTGDKGATVILGDEGATVATAAPVMMEKKPVDTGIVMILSDKEATTTVSILSRIEPTDSGVMILSYKGTTATTIGLSSMVSSAATLQDSMSGAAVDIKSLTASEILAITGSGMTDELLSSSSTTTMTYIAKMFSFIIFGFSLAYMFMIRKKVKPHIGSKTSLFSTWNQKRSEQHDYGA